MQPPTDLLKFRAATDPNSVIYYNRHPNKPFVLHAPSHEELNHLIVEFEAQIIERFWSKVILPPSPFHKTLPLGLASTPAGHANVDVSEVLQALTGICLSHDSRGSYLQRAAKAELRKHKMSELQCALQKIKPNTIEEAHAIFTVQGQRTLRATSLAAVARMHPRFDEFLSCIWTMAKSSGMTHAPVNLLVEMRSKGWILCPTGITQLVGNAMRGRNSAIKRSSGSDTWIPEPCEHITGPLADFYKRLKGEFPCKNRNEKAAEQVRCHLAVLCTSASSVQDLTWPLAEELLSVIGKYGTASRQRAHWRDLCEANGREAMRGETALFNPREELGNRCPADPRLNQWLDILAEQCHQHQGGNLEPVYKAYGVWLRWLATLDTVPKPEAVERQDIRNDLHPSSNTFRAYVEKLEFSKAKLRNEPLLHMSHVFERLWTTAEHQGRSFSNPIRYKEDRFYDPSRRNPGATTRSRIPEWITQELQQLMVAKTPTGYAWTDAVQNISVARYITPEGENVFNPIRPAIVYLMLVYPLRSNQVRWLDSGELDAHVYDSKTGKFCENPNPANEKRDAGCLQPASNGVDIDFQVAINKTLLESRRRSAFTIPYVTPECLWVIQQVLDWQKRYGTPPTLVKEVDEPRFRRSRQQNLASYYPELCPLFRSRDQESFYPPTSTQIAYFWGALCHAWDEKNLHWKHPKAEKEMSRPGVPKLSRVYEHDNNTWHVANFDLHSMRVAGVSSLLDAGLPLAVVASIAGHKTLAMTLHYYKAEQESLRVSLTKAYDKIKISKGFEEVAAKLEEIDSVDEYQKWFRSTPEGIRALHESRKKQAARMFLFGICPGTSCDAGLPDEFKQAHGRSVPGSRCPLCKYFVYGLSFLPGMIQEANCLLYELGEKANRQLVLRRQAVDAEDEGCFTQAAVLRNEEDLLEVETRVNLKVFVRLHNMIEEAMEMANASQSSKKELIVHGDGPGNLAVVTERISHFTQWHEIVAVAEMMPSNRQVVPDQALLRMQDRILGFLTKNGVEPFLLRLPEKIKATAILQFADLLERLIPDEDKRDQILDGDIALTAHPAVEQQLTKLIQQTTASQIQGNTQQRLQSPSADDPKQPSN